MFTIFLLKKDNKTYFLHPKARLTIYSLANRKKLNKLLKETDRKTETNQKIFIKNLKIENLAPFESLKDFCIENYSDHKQTYPNSYCGGLVCALCFKDLKKSHFFLINFNCCAVNIYNSKPLLMPSVPSNPPSTTCSFCTKSSLKLFSVDCICCFLFKNIPNLPLKHLHSCEVTDCYE